MDKYEAIDWFVSEYAHEGKEITVCVRYNVVKDQKYFMDNDGNVVCAARYPTREDEEKQNLLNALKKNGYVFFTFEEDSVAQQGDVRSYTYAAQFLFSLGDGDSIADLVHLFDVLNNINHGAGCGKFIDFVEEI